MSFFSQPKLHQSSPPHSPQFSHRFPYENRQSRRVDEGKSRWNHRGYKSNQSNQFEQTFVRLSDGSFAIRPDSSQDDIKNKSIHQTRFNDDDDDDDDDALKIRPNNIVGHLNQSMLMILIQPKYLHHHLKIIFINNLILL